MNRLPPLRRLDVRRPGLAEQGVHNLFDGDQAVAAAFGRVLRTARATRSLDTGDLFLFTPTRSTTAAPPPPAPAGRRWAPHLVALRDGPAIVWEAGLVPDLELALDARATDIAIWAGQPRALLTLAARAPTAAGLDPDAYLSLRWVLAHPDLAGAYASSGALEHVSVHVTPGELFRLRDLLVDSLGLVELPRPASIAAPGLWLACGLSRLHLNGRAIERQAPAGTAPNHICLAVASLDGAEVAVRRHGFAPTRAGSLGHQIWFRLASGSVFELQPCRAEAAPRFL